MLCASTFKASFNPHLPKLWKVKVSVQIGNCCSWNPGIILVVQVRNCCGWNPGILQPRIGRHWTQCNLVMLGEILVKPWPERLFCFNTAMARAA
jgi:hypothetical protein